VEELQTTFELTSYRKSISMEPEVVMNLWVFTQSIGPLNIICELGVRPYMMTGSDDEKTALLKELAISDFHFARRFSLPADRYYLKITEKDGVIVSASSGDSMEEGENVRKGLALVRPDISGMHQMEYFAEALDAIEKGLPTRRLGIDGPQTEMPTVNRRNLLSVITNVNLDGQGNQIARVEDARRNSQPSPVANLWLFHDAKANAIYAVAGRPYMLHGSDGEKVRILKALAPYDFSLTSALPLPEEFSAPVAGQLRKRVLAVSPDGKYNTNLFDGVFSAFRSEIPAFIGIDRKLKNRMTISSAQMKTFATRITEHSSNVGETDSIQLIESLPSKPTTAQAPALSSERLPESQTRPPTTISAGPAISMSQRSAIGSAKCTVESIGAGLEILRTMNELTPNVPKDEAALFAGTMTAVLNLVGCYPALDENGRQRAWWTMTRGQSYCAKYVKTNWTKDCQVAHLEVERPHLIAGRSPEDNVFNTTATEILIALLACLHTTFKWGSVPRSNYEPAIPCIRWLSENHDPAVSAQAKEILTKAESQISSKKAGCFVATAAFGLRDSNVILLQEFRDRILTSSFPGRCAVRIYYFVSPILARFIEASSCRQSLARKFLKPFIAFAKHRLEHDQRQKK
jgi:hypothetical protein